MTQNTGISNDNSDVSDDDLSSASGGVSREAINNMDNPFTDSGELRDKYKREDIVGGPGSCLPEGLKK